MGGMVRAHLKRAGGVAALAAAVVLVGCEREEPSRDAATPSEAKAVESPAPSSSGGPHALPAALEEAGRLCAMGRFDEARAMAEAYASEHPEDGRAAFTIGLTYHLAGNHGPAVAPFERAVTLDPAFLPARRYLGECLFMLGDLDGARAQYEALREAAPEDPEGAYRVGLVDLEEARLDEAEARLREAIGLFDRLARTDPRQFAARRATVARCHARLADVYFARDEYEAARGELIAATTIEPRNISAFFTLSQVYRRLGRDDLADRALERYEEAKRAIIEGKREGGG